MTILKILYFYKIIFLKNNVTLIKNHTKLLPVSRDVEYNGTKGKIKK